jgi:hypothetical protein
MSEVDPEDDNIVRHVVRHYAYDPERHERRHRVVAAFDRWGEAMDVFDTLGKDLAGRRERGEVTDPREHYTAVTLERGYREFQAQVRLLNQAIRRGISAESIAERLEIPSFDAPPEGPRTKSRMGIMRSRIDRGGSGTN